MTPGTFEASGATVRIDPPGWMTAAPTRAVMAALTAAGEARFVGGCVRNALLGRPAADIDIATTLRPDEVVRALKAAGLRSVPTGIEHGTVTALAHGQPFEITTLRLDVETDGRHAIVAFTDDWQADAARRDFTMNALFAAPDGRVWDHVGGVEDARAGRVRFVGDPDRRIAEDRLRLLRFFRFHAHYGRPPADAASLAACARAAPGLWTLSGERIRAETLKLLAAPDPVPAWRLMTGTGVAEALIGEPGDADRLAALVALERPESGLGAAPDPLRRLAALLGGEEAAADDLAARLRLSNAERARLVGMRHAADAVPPDIDARALRRSLYRLGAERVLDLVLLGLADLAKAAPARAAGEAARLLGEVRRWTPVSLPVGGRDAVEAGIPPGPALGALLRQVEAWWIASDFRPGRDACLAELRRLAGQGSA